MSEHFRPFLHFTPPHGWINDPNGLVHFNGEWHLFYQYSDPSQIDGMQWGHAVSKNLLKWEHLPAAIQPDSLGHIWSGSCVVDFHNSSGLFDGCPGIVSLFTYWDPLDGWQSQGLAYSRDGREFTKFPGNPVIPKLRNIPGQPDDGSFRDPKVFWHKSSNRWIMAVAGGKLRIFSSDDLIRWHFESVAEDIETECPDLFELPVDGNPDCTRWILSGGGRWYMIGDFDGVKFTPESERLSMTYGPDCYATQTWSDAPDGRRISIAWLFSWCYKCGVRQGRIENTFPTSPWAGGCLSIPYELTLCSTSDGIRLRQMPVREIENAPVEKMSDLKISFEKRELVELENLKDGALDIELEFGTMDQSDIMLNIPSADGGDYKLIFRPCERCFILDRSCSGIVGIQNFLERYEAPLRIGADGAAKIRIILDRCSVEIFCEDGLIHFSAVILPDSYGNITLEARGVRCRVKQLYPQQAEFEIPRN
jgi:fructan beta-fructosidase